jgi:ribose transport system substrate-binding protein
MNRGTTRRRVRWLSVAALGLATALLAACTAPADTGGDSDPAAGIEDVHLGIIGYSAADATLNKTAEEVVRLAEENGWETDYQAANPAGDPASANSIMQVMIQKGVNVILTMAFDTGTLGAGMAAAQEAGIPVLAMSEADLGPGVVWASNVGYVPEMGEQIKADFADSEKVEVLNLTYLLATPGQGRNQLIKDVAADDPKFNLTDKEVPIPGAVQGGRDFTAAWLAANPPTEGVDLAIYAVFDQPAEGAVAALKQAGRTDVKIYSYDATPAGLALVKEGYIVANVQNGRAAQAGQAIDAVERVASGELTLENPEFVPAAFFIVTTANVEQYEKDFPEAFTEEGV